MSKESGNPNSGSSAVGALGTGRGARSNGHKTCSEAMAASGSRRSQNKPRLFMEGDASTIGATYVRITGSMLESLSEGERQGRITLSPKYGVLTLIERWIQFGVPVILVLGLSMSEEATEKTLLWIIFKRAIALVSDEDLSMSLPETVVKIRKIGQSITLVTDNFVKRKLVRPTKEEDIHNVDPILRILASAQHLHDIGPAFQNLKDFVDEKRFSGTLRKLVTLEGPPRGSFNNRNCPMYKLRRQKWIDIFNHAMRADPYNGAMHTLDSVLMYMEQAQELLVQIAQCIRVYNFDKPRVGQKITVHQLVLDVIRLYDQSSSPVILTVPARAVAINTILGFSALFDMLKGHFDNRDRFLESLRSWGAYGDEDRAIRSPFWEDFIKLRQDALEWYGMDDNFVNISFNVLVVENGIPGDIARKNAKLDEWRRYADRLHSSAYDVTYEFDDTL